MKHLDTLVGALLRQEGYSITLFGKGRVTRVTRRGKIDRRGKSTDLVVTFGKPNYRERQWLKTGRAKRGKVVMRGYPQRRAA
jgi:hypothetical protein